MAHFYFSTSLDDETTLCLAPLTERRRSMASTEIADPSGYFLFERRGTGENAEVEIIARIDSEEAAFRLRELLSLD